MNAEPVLTLTAKTLHECRLEVILVGNAAAALQGAPVTTLDFDFMFRETPLHMKKLKKVARLIQVETGLQLNFMARLHGIKSFESLKSRAVHVSFGPDKLLVADLKDIIRSKRALGRPKDKAVLEIIEKTQHEKEKSKTAKPKHEA